MRNKKKYMFLGLIIIFLSVVLLSETKETISHKKDFPVSASALWSSVGNFASVDAFGKSDLKFEFNGTGVGMTRTIIFPNGFRIMEKLEGLDNDKKILRYSIFNNSKLPYKDYKGTLSVIAKDEKSCMLQEDVTFKTKIWKKKMAKKALLYFISTTFDNLEKNIAA